MYNPLHSTHYITQLNSLFVTSRPYLSIWCEVNYWFVNTVSVRGLLTGVSLPEGQQLQHLVMLCHGVTPLSMCRRFSGPVRKQNKLFPVHESSPVECFACSG